MVKITIIMKIANALLVTTLLFMATPWLQADEIVGTNGTFIQPFAPVATVTYTSPASGNGLETLVLDDQGSTTQSAGIWSLTAQGGSNVSLLGTVLDQTGAQVALTGTSLQFNRSNGPSGSILGMLGTSGNLQYAWAATASLTGFNYQPNTQYTLNFHVDGSSGLLQDLSGVTPTFQAEFVDGSGTPLTVNNGTTALNLAGVLGAGITSGDVSMTFNTGNVVPSGPIGIEFTGSAMVNSAASTQINNNMATVSGMTLDAQPVPEPAGASLVMACGLCVLFRRRRLERLR
jgi:hypothetical protein